MKAMRTLLLHSFLLSAAALSAQAPGLLAPSESAMKTLISGEKRAAEFRRNFHENPLSASFNIVYDQCYWKVDPSQRFISGHVNTYFIPLANLSAIVLDLSDSLTADSVLFQNSKINFTHSGNQLTINFPSSLSASLQYSADIYYHGTPPSDATGFGSFAQMKHGPDSTWALWTLSEPYGASDWWPCKNSLTDKIDSIDMFISVPSGYRDGSNGVLVSENTNGGITTFHWKHRYPIATYLVAMNAAVFSVYSDTAIYKGDTLQILNYIWREDSATVRGITPSLVPGMLLYDSLFEIYPFYKEKYGHAEMGWGGGMEHQTMTYAGNFFFELLVHECAHQWFGDKVTCGSWEDISLNEGFAVYLTDLCYEFLAGGYWWHIWKDNNLKTITGKPDGSVWVNDTASVDRIFSDTLTYAKGGYFLHQLRYQVGDSAFFAGVRNYLQDAQLSYGFARWNNLKAHLEASSGKNLTTYYNQWYFGEGFPSYQLNWSQDGSNLVTLTMDQTTSKPSSVPFFKLDVPVKFKNAVRDTTIRLSNTFSGQVFSIPLSFRADSALFDPDRWLITASNVVTGLSAFPAFDFHITVLPNPASSAFSVISRDVSARIESVKLMNLLGETVSETNLQAKANSVSFDCSGIPSGAYFLRIKTDRGEIYKKIVIE